MSMRRQRMGTILREMRQPRLPGQSPATTHFPSTHPNIFLRAQQPAGNFAFTELSRQCDARGVPMSRAPPAGSAFSTPMATDQQTDSVAAT